MTDQEYKHEVLEPTFNPQDWKNPPELSDLKNDLTQSQSTHDTAANNISNWLDVLNVTGSAKPSKIKGRSAMQPKTVKKLAEWRYPALSEPFLSTYDLFDVNPVTHKDKKSAYENQLLLNYQFNCQINKQKFIDKYIRTAVDQGTAILRTGWKSETELVVQDKKEIVITEDESESTIEKLQAIAMYMQSGSEQLSEVPEHWMEAFKVSYETGRPHRGDIEVVGQEEVEIETVNQPEIEVCSYKNVFIDPAAEGNIDDASFVIYSFETSKSDLEKQGIYSNLDQLKATTSPISNPDHAPKGGDGNSFQFNDEARKRMVAFEYWGYWDIDGTGKTKSIVVTWIDNVIIRMEENPYPDKKIPFEVVHYLPKDDNYGEPDAALTEENQKIIGAVTRGMIDTMGRSAAGQVGIAKGSLDVVNLRKFQNGQDYEYNSTAQPGGNFHINQFPELPSSVQFMLQSQSIDAESLAGIRPFANTNGGHDVSNMSATQARGILDAASKREVAILRRLSDGLIRAARKIVSMNAVFLSDEEVIRLTDGTFVNIKRDGLAGKYDFKMSVSTAEEDNAKAQELAFMLQTMGNNMPQELSKTILADIARLRNMPELAKKIESFTPQPDPVQQQLQQLEMQIKQAELYKILSETDENKAEAFLKQVKAVNLQSDTDRKDLDYINEAKGINHQRDLDKQGAQAQANMRYRAFEHGLDKDLEMDKAKLNNLFNRTNPQ